MHDEQRRKKTEFRCPTRVAVTGGDDAAGGQDLPGSRGIAGRVDHGATELDEPVPRRRDGRTLPETSRSRPRRETQAEGEAGTSHSTSNCGQGSRAA